MVNYNTKSRQTNCYLVTIKNKHLTIMKYLVIIFIFLCNVTFANPEGANVTSGNANFSNPNTQTLNIETSDKAVINWNGFSISQLESTNFIMPNEMSSVLNRVTGMDPSAILGSLNANGQVILINPNGIWIGQDACINTASFIGSTFDVIDSDFLNSNDLLFTGDSKEALTNLGKISATSGDVILISYNINNRGTLEAENGVVGLGAGKEVLIKPSDKQRIYIKTSLSDDKDDVGIENTGAIKALQTEIKADGNLYTLAIKDASKIDAFGIKNENGRVYLVADDGRCETSSHITCKNSDNTGGIVHILGKEVGILDESYIDVSGEYQGGTVLIGGDYGGKNPDIPNAKAIFISEDATINASCLESGDGGKVIFWGDEANNFYGTVLATGGSTIGDGGFVEVSSKTGLNFQGNVITTAQNGKYGTLLLDPVNITARAGGTDPAFPQPAGSNNYIPTVGSAGDPTTAFINYATLMTQLASGNVILDTSQGTTGGDGKVTLDSPFANSSWTGDTTLTVKATTDIEIFGGTERYGGSSDTDAFNFTATNGDIIFNNAAGGSTIDTTISGDGGQIKLQAPYGSITMGASTAIFPAEANADTIGITAVNLSLLGGNDANPGQSDAAINSSSNGEIDIILTGDLVMTANKGESSISGGNTTINCTGDISITAGANGDADISDFFTTQSHTFDINCRNLTLNRTAGTGTASIQVFDPDSTIDITATGAVQLDNASIITCSKKLDISASDTITLDNGSSISGNLDLIAPNGMTITDSSITSAANLNATMNNGGLTIQATAANSSMSAATDITINAKNDVTLSGTGANLATIQSTSGDVALIIGSPTSNFTMNDGSRLITDQGGDISINTYGFVTMTGDGRILPANTSGSGDISIFSAEKDITIGAVTAPAILTTKNGDILLSANNLSISDGAGGTPTISASGSTKGNITLTSTQNTTITGTTLTAQNDFGASTLAGTFSLDASAANDAVITSQKGVEMFLNKDLIMTGLNPRISKIETTATSDIGIAVFDGNLTMNNDSQIITDKGGTIIINTYANSSINGNAYIFSGFTSGSGDVIFNNVHGYFSMLADSAAAPAINTRNGDISITTDQNLHMTSSAGGSPIIFARQTTPTKGNVNIDTNHSVILTGATITSENALNIIAYKNTSIDANSILSAVSALNIVVDDQFPQAPLFGSDSLSIQSSAQLLLPGGIVRLYTSERSVNNIPANIVINGVSYTPSETGVETVHEKWVVYYPEKTSNEGPGFVIYYKQALTPSIGGKGFLFEYNLVGSEMFYDLRHRKGILENPFETPQTKYIYEDGKFTMKEYSSELTNSEEEEDNFWERSKEFIKEKWEDLKNLFN